MGLFDFLNEHNKKKKEIIENENRIERKKKIIKFNKQIWWKHNFANFKQQCC